MVKYNEKNQNIWNSFEFGYNALLKSLDRELIDGREKSLAKTKLEESLMWVGKALAQAQEYANMGTDPGNGLGGKNE